MPSSGDLKVAPARPGVVACGDHVAAAARVVPSDAGLSVAAVAAASGPAVM